jgi:hypothetical protein
VTSFQIRAADPADADAVREIALAARACAPHRGAVHDRGNGLAAIRVALDVDLAEAADQRAETNVMRRMVCLPSLTMSGHLVRAQVGAAIGHWASQRPVNLT